MSVFELVVDHGPHAGQTKALARGRIVIGRAADVGWPLTSDPTISRSHVEVAFDTGAVAIRDLDSTSGTYVNGVRLTPNASHPIKPGDRINLGQTAIRLVAVAHATEPQPPPRIDPNCCALCLTKYAFLGGKARSSRFPSLCNECAKELESRLERFRRVLSSELTFWNGRPADLRTKLEDHCKGLRLEAPLALANSAEVTHAFLHRVLTFLLQDGDLSESEQSAFAAYCAVLNVDESHIPQLTSQLRHYAFLRDIRSGNLPAVRASVMIPAGEIAHIEVPATYYRDLASGRRFHRGLLIATNKRLVFTQTDMPFEVALGKVLDVTLRPPRHLELQLARRQGTGLYECADGFYFVEVLRAILNFHLRHQVLQQSSSRAIPQDVKTSVWSRDGGKCVQCGDSQYLEFDHIIPYSQGGATSVANLQLLCRRCNLQKGQKL